MDELNDYNVINDNKSEDFIDYKENLVNSKNKSKFSEDLSKFCRKSFRSSKFFFENINNAESNYQENKIFEKDKQNFIENKNKLKEDQEKDELKKKDYFMYNEIKTTKNLPLNSNQVKKRNKTSVDPRYKSMFSKSSEYKEMNKDSSESKNNSLIIDISNSKKPTIIRPKPKIDLFTSNITTSTSTLSNSRTSYSRPSYFLEKKEFLNPRSLTILNKPKTKTKESIDEIKKSVVTQRLKQFETNKCTTTAFFSSIPNTFFPSIVSSSSQFSSVSVSSNKKIDCSSSNHSEKLLENNFNKLNSLFSSTPTSTVFSSSKSLPKKMKPQRPSQPPKFPRQSGPRAEALYNYCSPHPEDLNFKKGETIILEKMVGNDWAKGRLNFGGKSGLFPINYIHIIEPLPYNEIIDEKETCINDEEKKNRQYGIVLYNFEREGGDELSLKANEFVVILREADQEWLEGCVIRNNKIYQGLFPSSYIQVISYDNYVSACSSQNDHNIYNNETNKDEVFYFNIDKIDNNENVLNYNDVNFKQINFSRNLKPIDLKQHVNDENFNINNNNKNINNNNVYNEKYKIKIEESYKVMAKFDFKGEQEGDLSFKEGQIINVTRTISDDWLMGCLNDQIGIFPSNYVQKVQVL